MTQYRKRYWLRYRSLMATNLRLRPDAEAALRAEAERSGRSQQEILREALDRYLDPGGGGPSTSGDALLRSGALLPPRTRYRRVTPRRMLSAGVTSLELLDRDERV
jgi:Ribbon-helix-helix protein, copG family